MIKVLITCKKCGLISSAPIVDSYSAGAGHHAVKFIDEPCLCIKAELERNKLIEVR